MNTLRALALFAVLSCAGCSYQKVVVHAHYAGVAPTPMSASLKVEMQK